MTATDSKVLQVTNISPSVTMEQLETLFSFLGPIDEMQVFPKTNTVPVSSKVAFIKFQSSSPVATGQHLSHTVFIDKALICVSYNEDEKVAMQYVAPATSENESGHQIPGNVDPNKVEEIRRTIYVGNLDSKNATAEQLLTFFTTCGEVRFVRMAGDETQPTRFAFVEFADTAAVQNALQLNGMLFGDRPIKVNHSNNAIVKPQGKTQETNAKEIEEAMRRVREAQSLISKALEPEIKEKKRRSKSRSRSRSRHRRRRSRSRSRRRRSSSRSRRRRRSRSKSTGRSKSRRSRSRSKKRHRRSRSRSHKRSRSRKRDRSSSRKKERSSSRKKERSPSRKKERSPSRKKERSSSRKRDKERSKSRSRSKSPGRKSSRHKKDRKRDRDRDRSRESKKRRRSRSRSRSKDGDKKNGDGDKKTEDSEKKNESMKETSAAAETKDKTDKTVETRAAVITNGDPPKNGDT